MERRNKCSGHRKGKLAPPSQAFDAHSSIPTQLPRGEVELLHLADRHNQEPVHRHHAVPEAVQALLPRLQRSPEAYVPVAGAPVRLKKVRKVERVPFIRRDELVGDQRHDFFSCGFSDILM